MIGKLFKSSTVMDFLVCMFGTILNGSAFWNFHSNLTIVNHLFMKSTVVVSISALKAQHFFSCSEKESLCHDKYMDTMAELYIHKELLFCKTVLIKLFTINYCVDKR